MATTISLIRNTIVMTYRLAVAAGRDKRGIVEEINATKPGEGSAAYVYRCWLKERKNFFIEHGLSLTKGARVHKARSNPCQLSLFGKRTNTGRPSL